MIENIKTKVNLSEFRIRCSALGQVMTEPKTKKAKDDGELSQMAKSFCQSWLKEQLYQRRQTFASKYTEKGLTVEDDAIAYAAEQLGWGEVKKNTIRLRNEWIEGECDVLTDTHVHDIKSSWSEETFPLFETKIPTAGYEWQVQGYMWLYEVEQASVTYCLMDMPIEMIDREVRFKLGEYYSRKEYADFITRFQYSHLGPELRIKQFEFVADPDLRDQIKQAHTKCLKYMNWLMNPIEAAIDERQFSIWIPPNQTTK